MSTLLIGGNGLIGTRLSAYLADHGEEVFSYSFILPAKSIRVFITFRAT